MFCFNNFILTFDLTITTKTMKAYRFNAKKREDRKFNTTGQEKNPNRVAFYGKNLDYTKKYETVYDSYTYEELYKCTLEEVEVEANLFNMADNFKSLKTYKVFISEEISAQLSDYTKNRDNARTKKDAKMWQGFIDELVNREAELISQLRNEEFQQLSDFNYQNILIAEIKALGFDGYETKNEIAIF